MKIVRVNPEGSLEFRGRHDLFDLINDIFGDRFLVPASIHQEWNPSMDIYEKGGNYIVKADLPGMEEKDMSVEIKDNVLTISGKKEEEKETKDGETYRLERSSGSFIRSLTLPEGVKSDEVKADYNKGVLTVTLPKPKEAQTKKIEVKAS